MKLVSKIFLSVDILITGAWIFLVLLIWFLVLLVVYGYIYVPCPREEKPLDELAAIFAAFAALVVGTTWIANFHINSLVATIRAEKHD